MKYKMAFAVSACVFLASCNSFNRVNIHGDVNIGSDSFLKDGHVVVLGIRRDEPPKPPLVKQESTPVVKEKILYRTPKGWCPQFVYPKLPPMPDVPSEEFEKIPRENVEERMMLMFNHIQQLRSTMFKSREDLRNAYDDYLKLCINK